MTAPIGAGTDAGTDPGATAEADHGAPASASASSSSSSSASASALSHQAKGLAILLWACDPDAPQRLMTPFFHAAAAAAFDLPVEIYFSARSVQLLQPGVAAALTASDHPKTVYDAIREAVDHGAVLYACSDALAANGLAASPLIAECTHRGGAVQFVARAMDLRWRTLVF